MAARWALAGRQEELSRIRTVMGRAEIPGLVVTGPAGVGKTRLVAEALARAPAAKFCTWRVTATRAAAAMPLAALNHLLPERDPATDVRTDLLRRTARELAARGGSRRVVVAVDDAHLLDEASAALVHHLMTTSPVFVLATLRAGEPAPDAIARLNRDQGAEELALTPLSTDEVDEAVRLALGGPVSGSVVHRLTALSGGNPLLLTELVDTALAEGRLTRSTGLWCLSGLWVSANTLPELVRDRLSRLHPDVYAAVELLALGEPLGAADVEAMVPAAVVAAAEREGLLVASPDGRRQQVRLVHPLYEEALRAAITPLRARAIYRQLADTVEATGARRRGDVLRLALWRLDGGQAADPELLMRAAREDGALFDHDTAERLARAAEAAGGGLPARLLRVDALRWLGRAGEADEVLREVDIGSADAGQRCRLAAVRASNLYFGLNRTDDAERVIAEAREQIWSRSVHSGPELSSELDVLEAEFLFNAGRVGDAVDLSARVLSRSQVDTRVYVDAAAIATISRAFSGRSDYALAAVERALELLREAEGEVSFGAEQRLQLCRCLAHLHAGRLELAGRLAHEGYREALDLHAQVPQGQWAMALGELALAGGRVATARRWLQEAAALIEARSPTLGRYGIAYALTFLAEAAALAGDLDTVETALTRADALMPDGARLCTTQRGRVWAAAARGELSTARRLALHSADALAPVRAYQHEATACHDVVRLGAAELVVARLERLTREFEGPIASIYTRHAAALAAGDGPALTEVANAFSGVGADLLAAEAAAQASHAHRRAGSKASAAATAERSHELANRCEGAHTPALALAGEPSPLTPREREIATLASHGLSNRDIAETLVVSERTVHNHLHRAFAKLGITTRRQLRSSMS
ncbi:MAG: LuxR C-terminal-related transcriptional regulator [Pseudonocardia sp.]|nr:LuxR C-terminal-related transcriptional regulator [Pseudonocardia sp.]